LRRACDFAIGHSAKRDVQHISIQCRGSAPANEGIVDGTIESVRRWRHDLGAIPPRRPSRRTQITRSLKGSGLCVRATLPRIRQPGRTGSRAFMWDHRGELRPPQVAVHDWIRIALSLSGDLASKAISSLGLQLTDAFEGQRIPGTVAAAKKSCAAIER
jgi:hypothetical protein